MPVVNCKLADGVYIPYPNLVNIYDCVIGENTFIGPFCEIQSGVIIGKDCRIQSHSFLCTGVSIGNRVFVGHGVKTCNDKHPKIKNPSWKLETTFIDDDVSIGSNSTILPVRIGRYAEIGAGSVVTSDVSEYSVVAGNPARLLYRKIENA